MIPPQAARSRETSPEGNSRVISFTLPSGENLETDTHAALLVEGRPRGFGDDGDPAAIGGGDHPLHVRAEIDPHGVTEDVRAGSHGRMLGGGILSVVTGGAAARILSSIPFRLADGISGILRAAVKVGPGGWGGRRLRLIEQRLLRGWRRGRRRCRAGLRLLLGCRGWRSRLRGGRLRGDGLRRARPAHGLQLLQGLAIERRMGRFGDAVLIRKWGLRLGLDLLLRIGRKVEVSQVFLVVVGVDDMRLMAAKLRAVEEKPEEKQVSDDGDPNAFTA